MTRIILILNPSRQAVYIADDPRPPREVMVAINARAWTPGADEIDLGGARLWAMAHRSIGVVTVVIAAPPVELTPREYDALFGLAEGKSAPEIAADLGISVHRVYKHLRGIRDSFAEEDLRKALARAEEYGFLD